MVENDFTYKPTTAFWKIQKLIKDGISKFKDKEQKVFIIQGGQGAGKTISILMLLADYLQRNKAEGTICSAELTKVKDTVLNDFVKIMQDYNLFDYRKYDKTRSKYVIDSGHFVEFIGLDKEDIGKGRRRKYVYINEANKITQKQYSDITARAEIVIIDFNPDKHFWGHDLINDFNFINLTHNDNEYLSDNERNNILAYYEKGYNPDGTVKNEFWANQWRVYGLGEIGSIEGRVFTHFKEVDAMHFLKLPFKSHYGVDWGVNHKFAIIEGKYDRDTNTIFYHELNYKSENELISELPSEYIAKMNENGGIIKHTFEKLQIPKNADIVCDCANPEKILILRKYGWERAYGIAKPKGSIMSGISLMQCTNVFYTSTSNGIRLEQQNYSYAKDRLGTIDDEVIDDFNHSLDACRYLRKHFETRK